MKKILFFINSLVGGGAEKVLVDIVNNMDKKKYDITVQTVAYTDEYKNLLDSSVKYKYVLKPTNKILYKIASHFLLKKMPSKYFYNRFVEADYDFEVAFLEGMPTKVIAASDNPNKFAWVHTDLFNYYGQKKMFKSVDDNAECYKKFKRIFCVSQSAKEGFKKRFGFDDNVEVVYNPVDEKAIREKAKEPITEFNVDEKFQIVTVGRLVHQKGYDRLLRVHKRLMDEGFDYNLWIVGDGPERADLERYIEDNELENSVKLLGFQSNPYKFMNAADLFVCSSRAEGFSTVATEAIVIGTPVITANCSGMEELLGASKYGLITENSEEGIYNGLKKILLNEVSIETLKNVAQLRGKQFSMAESIKKIEEIFEQ